jgi:hypothetical protein
MGHLSSVEFVDLMDGLHSDASERHLAACDRCRREFAELRDTMAAAATDVPEPSPLFWGHLSTRVQQAVSHEASAGEWPRKASTLGGWWVRAAVALAAGAIVIAVAIMFDSPAPPPTPSPAHAQMDPAALPRLPDDGSFGLVADFGRTLEWDDLREQLAVSAPPGRLVDGGVGELDGGERLELERLLKQELARPAVRTDRS